MGASHIAGRAKQANRRQLASQLQTRGRTTSAIYSFGGNKKVALERYLAVQIWDAIIHGKFEFSDGTTVELEGFKEWHSIVKLLLDHVDGPVRSVTDLSDMGAVIKAYVGVSPDDWDKPEEKK
jgi:hypothetical protein